MTYQEAYYLTDALTAIFLGERVDLPLLQERLGTFGVEKIKAGVQSLAAEHRIELATF